MEYGSLRNSNQTRLFELQSTENFEEPLLASLLDISLESSSDKCQYYYLDIRKELTEDCWPDYGMILCNGRPLRVTGYLHNALRTIRAHGYCKLWVEAICINRADENDVEHHAKLAERIKRRATNVCTVRTPILDYSLCGSLTASPISIRFLRIQHSHVTENPLVVDIGIFPLSTGS